jgi:hypothetical protein
MRTPVLPVGIALLLGGCLAGEPLAPELKGRWAAPKAASLRLALLADRTSSPQPVAVKDDADCRDQYVRFEKRGIILYMDRKVHPLFAVQDVKREGERFILTGSAPVPGGHSIKIELVLRRGEIRFDDVVDQRGRSIRYERFDNEQARRLGVTSIGDVFRLLFDLKPCRA